MSRILVIAIKLVIITVVAGIALGVVNSITMEPIAAQAEKEATEARQAVFPDAADFRQLDEDIPAEYAIIQSVYEALDENGSAIGITAAVTTKGYSSGLNLTVGVGADGTIKGVAIGGNNETAGLGSKAPEVLEPQFDGGKPYGQPFKVVKHAPENDDEVQAIASATITSKAVVDAVNTVAAFYRQMAGGAQ